jgi:hypothetical protein
MPSAAASNPVAAWQRGWNLGTWHMACPVLVLLYCILAKVSSTGILLPRESGKGVDYVGMCGTWR